MRIIYAYIHACIHTYYNQYSTWINTGQYLPVVNFNINNNTININNTPAVSFTTYDIFTANDWVILNQILNPFTATLISGMTTISNVTITLSVGQYINGYGFPANTTVVSGSAGTYVLSNPSTITQSYAELTMTQAPTP